MPLGRQRDSAETGTQTDAQRQAAGKPGSGSGNMLPTRRGPRPAAERVFVRLVATTGIIGIAVLLGAVLTSNKVHGWIIGLVVGLVSVVLAALLWSSRLL